MTIHGVSALIYFQDKIILQKRMPSMKFYPGYWSLPGGTVQQDEEPLDALFRELSEELIVEQAELKKILSFRRELGELKSPDYTGLDVENRVLLFESSVEFSIQDSQESQFQGWVVISDFLAKWEDGQVLIVPPILEMIQCFHQTDYFFSKTHTSQIPFIEPLNGVLQLMPLSNTLPPYKRTNSFYFKEASILVDPSPQNENELLALFTTLQDDLSIHHIKYIFLSHHHPDHWEFANKVAQKFHSTLLLSEYTWHKIQETNAGFFKDISFELVSDRQILGHWKNKAIIAAHLPGHAVGMMGLYVEDRSWFFVADLIQGKGSVVISTEKGSMQAYYDSLDYVINKKPNCLFPSHGMAIGGSQFLYRIKKHRLLREKQIENLYNKNKTIDEIVEILYGDYSELLKILAHRNIESHLERILDRRKK